MENIMKGQNADVKGLMKAKNECPPDGYVIPVVVAEWMSDDSLDVMRHFGIEAPDLLNKYCNSLEDSLIDCVNTIKELEKRLRKYEDS